MFIEQALASAVEKELVLEGEYDLTCEDGTMNDEGTGVTVRVSIDGHPNAKKMFHNISLVSQGDDPEKANNKLLFQKAFFRTFGIKYEENGFELDDVPGAKATNARVGQDTYKGQTKNKIVLSI